MISVIIPMYNAQESIIRCLESVIKQTYNGDMEIIVINDGSTDKSPEIVEDFIKKHPDFKIQVINQENGGVSKARNAGLKIIKGDYIAFLDSDDAWFLDKLTHQIRILENNLNIDLLGTAFKGVYFSNIPEGELVNVKFKKLIFKNYFQPSTVIIKKHVIDRIGLFDESQKYAEEGNFFLRIAQKFNCFFYNNRKIISSLCPLIILQVIQHPLPIPFSHYVIARYI